jgi:uncharacterized membrane protein YraQ (UPF0718 family)
MTQLSLFLTLLISLFLEALPFLLLGILVSSGILVFVDRQWGLSRLPRNRVLAAIVGSSLGMILPVGQYGQIPVTRRFIGQGMPLSIAISYLIAAPTINPYVLWVTLQTFGDYPKLAFFRLVFVWMLAVAIGVLFSLYAEPTLPNQAQSGKGLPSLLLSGTTLIPEEVSQPLQRSGSLNYEYAPALTHQQSWRHRWLLFADNMRRETLELGGVLLMSCAIAALIQVYWPLGELLRWGQSPIAQIGVMGVMGIVLSLGAIASTVFASVFVSNFLSGSLLALLIGSSFLDLRTMGLLFATFRPKFAIYLWLLVALALTLLTLSLNFYMS